MALDAIQKTPNSPNQVSYIKASATGALAGYALKYFVPVTYQEKDENYNDALKQNQLDADAKKAASIEQIRQSKNKTELTDTFIRLYDSKKLNPEDIKKLKVPLRDNLLDMVKKLDETWKESFAIGKKNLNAVTKRIRPTGVFVGVGLVIGFIAALVTNVIRRIDFYNAQYHEDAESD